MADREVVPLVGLETSIALSTHTVIFNDVRASAKHGDTLTRRMFEDIVIQEEEHYWKFDDYVR